MLSPYKISMGVQGDLPLPPRQRRPVGVPGGSPPWAGTAHDTPGSEPEVRD